MLPSSGVKAKPFFAVCAHKEQREVPIQDHETTSYHSITEMILKVTSRAELRTADGLIQLWYRSDFVFTPFLSEGGEATYFPWLKPAEIKLGLKTIMQNCFNFYTRIRLKEEQLTNIFKYHPSDCMILQALRAHLFKDKWNQSTESCAEKSSFGSSQGK